MKAFYFNTIPVSNAWVSTRLMHYQEKRNTVENKAENHEKNLTLQGGIRYLEMIQTTWPGLFIQD
mgnify:FL=1